MELVDLFIPASGLGLGYVFGRLTRILGNSGRLDELIEKAHGLLKAHEESQKPRLIPVSIEAPEPPRDLMNLRRRFEQMLRDFTLYARTENVHRLCFSVDGVEIEWRANDLSPGRNTLRVGKDMSILGDRDKVRDFIEKGYLEIFFDRLCEEADRKRKADKEALDASVAECEPLHEKIDAVLNTLKSPQSNDHE